VELGDKVCLHNSQSTPGSVFFRCPY